MPKPAYRSYLATADDIISWAGELEASGKKVPPALTNAAARLTTLLVAQYQDFRDKKIGEMAVAVPARLQWINKSVADINVILSPLRSTIDGMSMSDKLATKPQYDTGAGHARMNPEIARQSLAALSANETAGVDRNPGAYAHNPFMGIKAASKAPERSAAAPTPALAVT